MLTSLMSCSDSRKDVGATAGEAGEPVGGAEGGVGGREALAGVGGRETLAGVGGREALAGVGGTDAGGVSDAGQDPGSAGMQATAVPTITSLSPERFRRGDTVTIRGQHFLPAPQVSLGSTWLQPSQDPSDEQLTFVAPENLAFTACEQELDVVVRNQQGSSSGKQVTLVVPPPSLAVTSAHGAAGTPWVLKGQALAGAVVELEGKALATRIVADTELSIDIPRDAKIGAAALNVETECGTTSLPIDVSSPPPLLLSKDLDEVAPGGVVMLRVDLSNGAKVESARVGGIAISPLDGTSFRWKPDEPATLTTRTLAIRVPTTVPSGARDIALIGSAEASSRLDINFVSALTPQPGPASSISFPPSGSQVNTFPLGTAQPFPQKDLAAPPPADGWSWSYDLTFHRQKLESTPDGKTVCGPVGTISGIERRCPNPEPSGVRCQLANGCPGVAGSIICNTLSGQYEFDTTRNLVNVAIDRQTPEGPEQYVGGWMTADEAGAGSGRTYLVLRSKRTGRQLVIEHSVNPGCIF